MTESREKHLPRISIKRILIVNNVLNKVLTIDAVMEFLGLFLIMSLNIALEMDVLEKKRLPLSLGGEEIVLNQTKAGVGKAGPGSAGWEGLSRT